MNEEDHFSTLLGPYKLVEVALKPEEPVALASLLELVDNHVVPIVGNQATEGQAVHDVVSGYLFVAFLPIALVVKSLYAKLSHDVLIDLISPSSDPNAVI